MGSVHKLKHQEYLFFNSRGTLQTFLLNIGFSLRGGLLINLGFHLGQTLSSQLLCFIRSLMNSIVAAARSEFFVHLGLSLSEEFLLLSSALFSLLLLIEPMVGFDLFSVFFATGCTANEAIHSFRLVNRYDMTTS